MSDKVWKNPIKTTYIREKGQDSCMLVPPTTIKFSQCILLNGCIEIKTITTDQVNRKIHKISTCAVVIISVNKTFKNGETQGDHSASTLKFPDIYPAICGTPGHVVLLTSSIFSVLPTHCRCRTNKVHNDFINIKILKQAIQGPQLSTI